MAERLPFFGFNPSAEVRRALTLFGRCDTKQNRAVLELVAPCVASADAAPRPEQFAAAAAATGLPIADAEALFTGMLLLMRAAVRTRTSPEFFKADLALPELKVSAQLVADMAAVLAQTRAAAETNAMNGRIRHPSLANLNWRVDVTISSSSLARVLAPSVLMEMTTTDGRVCTFEVTQDKFHDLRYNVARVLKETQELEQMPILKIAK
eukprot:TRINITY_DN7745_c0_g1_i1.p3 TRINITY_DN7745_c0_g1~~TRINITY_DN7745_c0_g1_i1.p3  ORF type:complete len:225 (-),score=81.41 TRINITY_DN7745_c0_g1_i1:123-749(-)